MLHLVGNLFPHNLNTEFALNFIFEDLVRTAQ